MPPPVLAETSTPEQAANTNASIIADESLMSEDGQGDLPGQARLVREVVTEETEGGHFFGAGTHIDGVTTYNDYKPPNAVKRVHNKTFYLEFENENWCSGFDETPEFQYMIPPYYNMLWHALCWYLDFGEFHYYRKYTNWARLSSVVFQVNVVGHRLPFSTNEEASSIANSQVDQQLDVFRGMERRYPHSTIYKTGLEDKHGRPVKGSNVYYQIAKTLYGYDICNHSTARTKVSANRGYRRWRYLPKYHARTIDKSRPVANHPCRQATWPSFASSKWQSIDLAKYRGPVATIAYKTKGGLLGQQPSIIVKPFTHDHVGGNIQENMKMMHLTDLKDFRTNSNKTIGSRFHNSSIKHVSSQSVCDIQNLYLMSNVDCEYQQNSRNDPIIPCYNSLFLGVRPQMNGAKHQQGILAVEIRTECVVEFQLYFSVPMVINWHTEDEDYNSEVREDQIEENVRDGWTGLSNDIDLARLTGLSAIPNYACGNKLYMINVEGEIPHSRLSRRVVTDGDIYEIPLTEAQVQEMLKEKNLPRNIRDSLEKRENVANAWYEGCNPEPIGSQGGVTPDGRKRAISLETIDEYERTTRSKK